MKRLLTVIIPAYNCAGYIRECIESALGQLPDGCELVVVDDGSTDDTRDVLASYQSATSNVKVLYREHKGASAARNAGLEAASGAYVAFLDCDDTMKPGFLAESLRLFEEGADLYIFGIERVPLLGNSEFWTVADARYPSASAFADAYIRNRNLLVYSNCNKFYRRTIIEEAGLRFDEDSDFGEDRLFNYAFIKQCGSVVTSSSIMLTYLQRSVNSLSSRHVERFYERVMDLHEAKMECFVGLSRESTEDEKADFRAYDLSREIETCMNRFSAHPEERDENLPLINGRVFGGADGTAEHIDALIVMGSRNCDYKAKRALEIGSENPDMVYIVSGGNLCYDGVCTEAEYMAAYLREHGVANKSIYIENRAHYTKQNLSLSIAVVDSLRAQGLSVNRIGILTSGFHVPRTRLLAANTEGFHEKEVLYFAAYGPNTKRDGWYTNPKGRSIVLEELRKTVKLECEGKTGKVKRREGAADENEVMEDTTPSPPIRCI